MRRLLVVLLAAPAVANLTGQTRLDEPIQGRVEIADPAVEGICESWLSIAQLAYRARVRLGFETARECRPFGYGAGPDFTDRVLLLDRMTPRAALDRFVELRPEFVWKDIGGVAVIRPAAAWQSPADVLQHRVAPFSVDGVHPHHALHAMLQSAQPALFIPNTDVALSSLARRVFHDRSAIGEIDRPISVAFHGGTLLDALNAVAEPVDGIWHLFYLGNSLHITLQSLKERDGLTNILVPIGPP